MGLKARLLASKLGFGPQGWNLGFKAEIRAKSLGFGYQTGIWTSRLDLDSKIFLGQPVALSFAWTCSVLSILHVSNFKVLAQIL